MSARNMVRNLRDSGALDSKPPGPSWTKTLLFFVSALAFGAVAYFGAIYALPGAMKAMQRKPVEVAFAKPMGEPQAASGLTATAKSDPFTREDHAACLRYAESVERQAQAALDREREKNMFSLDMGTDRIAKLSAQLICEAQTRPLRLCDEGERAGLVKHTHVYLDQVQAMLGMAGMAMNSPGFALVPRQHEGAAIARSLTNQSVLRIRDHHRRVTAVFRDLATKGLISEADFGGIFGAREGISLMFAELPAVRQSCAA
jgi:hypothetical protein